MAPALSASGLEKRYGATEALAGIDLDVETGELVGLLELFRFPGWYSADELLGLHQRLAGSHGGAGERGGLLELDGLAEARSRRVDAMSKGMQQRSRNRADARRLATAAPARRADQRARSRRAPDGS